MEIRNDLVARIEHRLRAIKPRDDRLLDELADTRREQREAKRKPTRDPGDLPEIAPFDAWGQRVRTVTPEAVRGVWPDPITAPWPGDRRRP